MTGQTIQSRIVKDEAFQYRFSPGSGVLRMFKIGDAANGFWWTGEFLHPNGIVSVYRQEDYTRLDLVFQGKVYCRGWRRYYGNRTISRLAREFLADKVLDGGGNGR